MPERRPLDFLVSPLEDNMKRGMKVAVCYDGKYGRRVPGIVTATRRGHHIKVRFIPYASEDNTEVESWFRIKRSKCNGQRKYFGGWARYENALMPMLFTMFGATAPGDYYTVHKWPNA